MLPYYYRYAVRIAFYFSLGLNQIYNAKITGIRVIVYIVTLVTGLKILEKINIQIRYYSDMGKIKFEQNRNFQYIGEYKQFDEYEIMDDVEGIEWVAEFSRDMKFDIYLSLPHAKEYITRAASNGYGYGDYDSDEIYLENFSLSFGIE